MFQMKRAIWERVWAGMIKRGSDKTSRQYPHSPFQAQLSQCPLLVG